MSLLPNKSFPVANLKLLLLALTLTGCAVSRPPLLDDRTAAFAIRSASLAGPTTVAVSATIPTPSDWWLPLGDPVLNTLVTNATVHNFTVQAATVRLAEARGIDSASIWSLLPTGSVSGRLSNSRVQDYSKSGISFGGPPTSGQRTATGSFSVAWELPLFGRAGAVTAQAAAQLNQARWTLEAARLSVASEVVRSYAELRGIDETLRLYEKSVSMLTTLIRYEEQVVAHGVSTQTEVNALEARLLDQRALVVASKNRRQQLIAKLDSLLGQADGAELELLAGAAAGVAPLTLPVVTKLQANTLRMRPDVRVAEEAVELAAARAGIAAANLWPQFSLGGDLNRTVGSLDSLGTSKGASQTLMSFVGLKIPLLDWFALKAEANAKNLELTAVTMDYRQTIVAGWEEARSAFADYAMSIDRKELTAKSVMLAEAEISRQHAFTAAGMGTLQAELGAEIAANEKRVALVAEELGAVQAWAKLVKASFVAQ